MPKSKRYGEYWHECYRCGRDYPEHMISKNIRDQWICQYCWDTNENAERKSATGTGP